MELHYNKEGFFKIMQLTDLHLGEVPSNQEDKKTYAGIKKTIETNTPDLILFTGDIVYSSKEQSAAKTKESLQQFIEFINSFEVPYAYTFGNHDAEVNVTREELHEVFAEHAKYAVNKKHSFFVGNRENYVIELLSSETNEVKQIFYVIDSGDYSHTKHSYYAWVLPEQISWFKEIGKNYKRNDGQKNNLIFQHIPLPEYWLASQNMNDGVFNEAMTTGSLSSSTETDPAQFSFENAVFSPEVNSGFFLEILLNEEVWGMFVGHDHDNSFDGIYKDIHLVYGQSSGYNTYGTEPKGARIIELSEKEQSVKTFPVFYE